MLCFRSTVKHLVLVTPLPAHSSERNMWVCSEIQLEQLSSTQLGLWLSWFYTHSVLVLYTDVNATLGAKAELKTNEYIWKEKKQMLEEGWMVVMGIRMR